MESRSHCVYADRMERLPLPEEPALRAAAELLEEQEHVAEIYDAQWRVRYLTAGYLVSAGVPAAVPDDVGIGLPIWSAKTADLRDMWPASATRESHLDLMRRLLPLVVQDLGGDPELLGTDLPPELVPDFAATEPGAASSLFANAVTIKFGRRTTLLNVLGARISDEHGSYAGWVVLALPALSGALLSLLGTGDHSSLERLLGIVRPDRRPGAILFVDLQGSTALARRLPAAAYFQLVRRLTTRVDDEIVARGGVVGKHAGDGATAFFLVEHATGESAAARACVETALAIRGHADSVAIRSGLEPGEVRLRFGLHWGSTLYVGRLLTAGRAEVTALGDEVNEAARIEACAVGGRVLVSKDLVERLNPSDASALGIDATVTRFTLLAHLDSATEKARRDAPSLAVTEF
jgi:class 3 adenylate cyclase